MLWPSLIGDATKKIHLIQDRLKFAQDRQRKYYDSKHQSIEFQVRDFVSLKVSSIKEVI